VCTFGLCAKRLGAKAGDRPAPLEREEPELDRRKRAAQLVQGS